MTKRNTMVLADNQAYFVWVKSSKGPTCEKWYGNQTTGTDKFKHGEVGQGHLLAFHRITEDEAKLRLDELETKYPLVVK